MDELHGVWRSLVARFVRDEEAVGSNPATPTDENVRKLAFETFEDRGVYVSEANFPDR